MERWRSGGPVRLFQPPMGFSVRSVQRGYAAVNDGIDSSTLFQAAVLPSSGAWNGGILPSKPAAMPIAFPLPGSSVVARGQAVVTAISVGDGPSDPGVRPLPEDCKLNCVNAHLRIAS